jgi:hypothetical protein
MKLGEQVTEKGFSDHMVRRGDEKSEISGSHSGEYEV